jgi:hypothetical protein
MPAVTAKHALARVVHALLPPGPRDPRLVGDDLVWHVGSDVVRLPMAQVRRVTCTRTPHVGDELVVSGAGASVRIRLTPGTERLRHHVGRRLAQTEPSVVVSAQARLHLGLE